MRRLFLFLIFSSLIVMASESFSQPLAVGDSGPQLETRTQNGKTLRLNRAFYEGLVLFFFYPKADTPECTSQACSLRDAYPQLLEAGVKIFGVSFDSSREQQEFAQKYDLPYPLIPDPEGKVIQGFGVPSRASGGQSYAARQAYLLRDGEIIWRDLSASTHTQAEDVLQFLENR